MSTMESYLVTELCTACTRGDLDNVIRLIKLGASPWLRDDQGNTLFHLCCNFVQCGLELLEYLISVSGIVNCDSLVNNEGSTLLHLACFSSGNVELVRYLVEEVGCDINAKENNDHTSLHIACEKNQLEIVKFLTSKPKCNRESVSKLGNKPLHLACGLSGNVELVRFLVEEAGCDINTKETMTPLPSTLLVRRMN